MKIIPRVAAALLALACSATVLAQSYPARPVRLVVAFPPGGNNDILARMLSERLQKTLGQPFPVENRSGAGGMIGTDAVAKAAPDGYTLLVGSNGPLAVGPTMMGSAPYDTARHFAPVATLAAAPVVMVAHAGFRAQSVKEVIEYARANPEALRFALPAMGTIHHVMTAWFGIQTKTRITIVPYKGAAPAIADLIAGHVDVDLENLPGVLPHIRSGRLRALAVTSPERTDLLPEVPTFRELGFPDMVGVSWFVLAAPAGTPREIVVRLNEAVNAYLREDATKAELAKQGSAPMILTPEQSGQFVAQEIQKWSRAVKESGAKPQ